MAKKRIASNRSDYLRLLIKYKTLRKNLKAQYTYGDPQYRIKVEKIKRRIDIYNGAILRIDKINNKIRALNDKVKYRYNTSFYKSVNGLWAATPEQSLLRKMFCKYVMEKRIEGNYISDFIGWKDKTQASRYRLEINQLIKNDNAKLLQWQKFRIYMNKKVELKFKPNSNANNRKSEDSTTPKRSKSSS